MTSSDREPVVSDRLADLLVKLDDTATQLAEARDFAKPSRVSRVFDTVRRILVQEGGCEAVEERAQALEAAGVFEGSDWATPQILAPVLATRSLASPNVDSVVIEALSELRLLAVASGRYSHPLISAEQAHHYLTQALAINLGRLFTPPTEIERETQGRLAQLPRILFRYLARRIGYEHIIDQLIDEIWRILQQRPIQVDSVKLMIGQIAVCQANPDIDLGTSGQGAARLVSSLFGPTQGCREDPGLAVYEQRLAPMDTTMLQNEATGFARAMHDTGLVSPYHPVLVRYLLDKSDHLLCEALGLSVTGRDCLLCYRELIQALIAAAVHPATPQSIYGLALMMERGILYQPAVAPALWRQLRLVLSPDAEQHLKLVFGDTATPHSRLLEGVLCMLGQPLGVGQGNNPTCQSARALSMWAYNNPDYLLQIIVWAGRDDEIVMHFEGQRISSRHSRGGVAGEAPTDLDPVSLLVVPHLDRIYTEMGRRCADRNDDPHRWINPEFHGWWVGRGFSIDVDVATGQIANLEGFLRHFYSFYHPYYNGNQPLIHIQPAGVAITDSAARFIGWHAITILRVALDPNRIMRVYFYNPNNDSGQDWGNEVKVSTTGNGEYHGEASLPFEQFASRLYIFHYDPQEPGELAAIPADELNRVVQAVHLSWGADRLPAGDLQALEPARDTAPQRV